jgi:hypothetical protein
VWHIVQSGPAVCPSHPSGRGEPAPAWKWMGGMWWFGRGGEAQNRRRLALGWKAAELEQIRSGRRKAPRELRENAWSWQSPAGLNVASRPRGVLPGGFKALCDVKKRR